MKRRQFLRGLSRGALVTVALPSLELFSRPAFASEGFPHRFLYWYWGNGNRPELWTPATEGVGDQWALSESLLPLQAFKEKLSVITGMSIKVPNILPHNSGLVGISTGQAAVGDESSWTVAAPSIDQVIAEEIGRETVYRSITSGCVSSSSLSWNGPNSRNPVEGDPYEFYQKLFGDTFREPGSEGIVDPRLGYRRSVLDSVMEDIAQLSGQLGSSDKIRLEQHLDGVRELELRLARLQEDPPALESCIRPEEPNAEYPDIDSRPQFEARNEVMSQMVAMALACDQTRILTYNYTHALNNHLFPNTTDGHHNLTHHEPGEQPEVAMVTHHCMEAFAHFLGALDAIPEGEGTLLDNCTIMCTSEVSEGRTHSLDEIPLLIAGGTQNTLVRNQHYRSYTQDNVNTALLSIIRSMGINKASHGDGDSYVEQGLSAIEI